jgi:hypothetical protein
MRPTSTASCSTAACDEPDPRELMRPFPSVPMQMWPISARVNKPENDDHSIVDPIEFANSAAEETEIEPQAASKASPSHLASRSELRTVPSLRHAEICWSP